MAGRVACRVIHAGLPHFAVGAHSHALLGSSGDLQEIFLANTSSPRLCYRVICENDWLVHRFPAKHNAKLTSSVD